MWFWFILAFVIQVHDMTVVVQVYGFNWGSGSWLIYMFSRFMSPQAEIPINVDSKSFKITQDNMKNPDRYIFLHLLFIIQSITLSSISLCLKSATGLQKLNFTLFYAIPVLIYFWAVIVIIAFNILIANIFNIIFVNIVIVNINGVVVMIINIIFSNITLNILPNLPIITTTDIPLFVIISPCHYHDNHSVVLSAIIIIPLPLITWYSYLSWNNSYNPFALHQQSFNYWLS